MNVLIVEVKIVKNMKPYNGLEVFTILFYIKKIDPSHRYFRINIRLLDIIRININ